MKRLFKRILNRITANRWVPVKCYFPYPRGYATYHVGRKLALDFRLTKEEAQERCDNMNEAALN